MPISQESSHFADMGGYGLYVFGAYGFAAGVLLFMLAAAWRASRRAASARKGTGH